MKIRITENELREVVKDSINRVLNEERTINQYEVDGHMVSVKDYNMKDSTDKQFLKDNKKIIWEILQNGYEKLGGFKGYASLSDLVKKTSIMKLGFCDGDIITVTVYNDYLGGNKLVGATCIKNGAHRLAVELLKIIIDDNIKNLEQWIWVEASGKIEEMCRELGGFNVKAENINLFFPADRCGNVSIIDEYHYQRPIGGVMTTKTIFGFNNRSTYEKLINASNDVVKGGEDELNMISNNYKVTESVSGSKKLYMDYMSERDPIYAYKRVIDYYLYLKDDCLYNEFLPEAFGHIKIAIEYIRRRTLEKNCPDFKIMRETMRNGWRIIRTSTVLKPLVPLFKKV